MKVESLTIKYSICAVKYNLTFGGMLLTCPHYSSSSNASFPVDSYYGRTGYATMSERAPNLLQASPLIEVDD